MTTGVYITKRGATIEKKPIFITVNEWEMLWELSAASAIPIGTLIVKLALAETDRIDKPQQATKSSGLF